MKLLNYSLSYLAETMTPEVPKQPYSKGQYRILCRVIIHRHVKKTDFYRLIYELYGHTSYKQLTYEEMYRLIYILNHWYQPNRKENHNERPYQPYL